MTQSLMRPAVRTSTPENPFRGGGFSCVVASISLVATMALGGCRDATANPRIHTRPPAWGHALSYDGAKMIVLNDHEGGTFVDVVETASGRSFGLLSHSFIRAVWGETSDIAYAVAKDKQIYRLSLGSNAERIDKVSLTGPEAIPADQAPSVLRFPSPAAPFLVARTSRRHQRLYRCVLRLGSGEQNIKTRCRVLIEDGRGVLHWLMTAKGRSVARIKVSPAGQHVFQSLTPSGEWASLFAYTQYYTELVPIGSVQQDGTVWVLSNRQRERVALVRLNVETGTEEVFFEHDRYDLTKAIVLFDKDGEGTPLLVSYNPDYQVVVHFHDGLETAYEALYEKVGKPSRIDLGSIDLMAKSAVVEVANPQLYRSWYLLDLEKNTSRELSGSSLASYRHPPSPSRPVTFPARDGLTLHGYLTLPQGLETPGPPPMILMLHGGPWSRYFWPDSSFVQFLSSKGYAVLRLNYRGSRGYRRGFLEAGMGTVFGPMQHDVLDAAEWAIANGHAARDRITLYGGSFGGFLTLVMLAHHPDSFKAGIAINSVTDAVDFWKTDWLRPSNRILWREFFGSRDLPELALAEISPINNIDRIVASVQLIAGSRDKRVPVSQSQEMFHLLKEGGKSVEFVEFDHASHSIPESHVVASIEAFLEEHLSRKPGTR